MAILFVLNVIVMLVIGKLAPRPTAYSLNYSQDVDVTPWKHVTLAGIGITVIVAGIYVWFG